MTIVPLAIGVGVLALLALTGKKKEGVVSEPTPQRIKEAVAKLKAVQPNLPEEISMEIINVLRRLNVQLDGTIQPPITKEDIQVATALAGKLERRGFTEAAVLIRALVAKAARYVPSPPPSRSTDLPGVDAATKARITRALQLERDPKKLSQLLQVVKALPASSERDALATSIESLITQLAAAASTADTLEKTQQIIDAKPGKAPEVKTAAGRLAQQLAASMIALENRYGVKRAKPRRDVKLVVRFQKAVKLSPDGKPGTKTVLAMARNGVSRLPLVMYWPRSATSKNVLAYRRAVGKLAAYAKSMGQTQRAAQLLASAKRERGQGGIVGR